MPPVGGMSEAGLDPVEARRYIDFELLHALTLHSTNFTRCHVNYLKGAAYESPWLSAKFCMYITAALSHANPVTYRL